MSIVVIDSLCTLITETFNQDLAIVSISSSSRGKKTDSMNFPSINRLALPCNISHPSPRKQYLHNTQLNHTTTNIGFYSTR